MLHFDRERTPERVVHALGHAAYGTFTSYGDWSNITSACWLKPNTTSDVFTRFSVVVAGTGGADTGRDTHGFATKIYSECGNQDLVGNHLPSFFITDGALFPDLINAVKAEPDKGFPTGMFNVVIVLEVLSCEQVVAHTPLRTISLPRIRRELSS